MAVGVSIKNCNFYWSTTCIKRPGPVVQNFDCLTLSLSPQFVNYILTSKANTLLFFVEMQRVVPRRYFCGGSFCFMSWCLKIFLCCWRLLCVFIVLVKLR